MPPSPGSAELRRHSSFGNKSRVQIPSGALELARCKVGYCSEPFKLADTGSIPGRDTARSEFDTAEFHAQVDAHYAWLIIHEHHARCGNLVRSLVIDCRMTLSCRSTDTCLKLLSVPP